MYFKIIIWIIEGGNIILTIILNNDIAKRDT